MNQELERALERAAYAIKDGFGNVPGYDKADALEEILGAVRPYVENLERLRWDVAELAEGAENMLHDAAIAHLVAIGRRVRP